MKRLPLRSKNFLALASAIVLIIAGLVGTSVVASAASAARGAWNYNIKSDDSSPGALSNGKITWKKVGRCYDGRVSADIQDLDAGDSHGAIVWYTYTDCRTGKGKQVKFKTTHTTRFMFITVLLKNSRDVRVQVCLYVGRDETIDCNSRFAS
jgi:hypothetical protein